MKILFLARSVNAAADFGDGVHVRELIAAWVRAGHEVDLVCIGDDVGANAAWLRSQLETSGIWVVPTNGIWRFYHPRQLVATRIALRVARSKDFQAIYARPPVGVTGSFDASTEVLTAYLTGLPLFLEINGWSEMEASLIRASRFFGIRPLTRRITRMLFARTRGFIAVNNTLAARLRSDLNVAAEKIRVVPNGANPDLFSPQEPRKAREALGLSATAPVLGFIGHIGLEADLESAIASLPLLVQDFPELLMLVVGGGEDIPRYRSLAERCAIASRVRFIGSVRHALVPTYINAADIGLVAIRPDLPGTPMKLFEYWSCGRPVVGTKHADLHIIEDVGGGLQVQQNTAKGWAEAVRGLLRNTTAAAEMGRLGREYVLQERTWARTADTIAGFVGKDARVGNHGPSA